MEYASPKCTALSVKKPDVDDVCLCGFTPSMLYGGPEYLACATMRFAFKGEREIIACHAPDIWDFLSKRNAVSQQQMSSELPVTHVVGEKLLRAKLDSEWMQNLLQREDKIFWRGIIPEKSVIFIPAGMIMLERTVSGQPCTGFRLAVHDKSELSLRNLKLLLSLRVLYAADDHLAQLWKQLLA